MKTILTLVHDDPGLESRLQATLDLTRALHAQLICLELTIPLIVVGGDPFIDAMVLEPETVTEACIDAKRRVDQSGLHYHWVERRGELAPEIAEFAKLADLVVLSSAMGLQFSAMRGAIGRLLVKSQKAVFAVPCSTTGVDISGEAMLLWDGSRGAHAAMAAAMPLYRQASRVTILEVDDGSLQAPALHASAQLSKCGIASAVESLQASGEKAEVPILERIDRLRPAFVAMGGFGHARLVEQIFGGVTERLLRESPVPLFLKN